MEQDLLLNVPLPLLLGAGIGFAAFGMFCVLLLRWGLINDR
jgi:hypothetical protein